MICSLSNLSLGFRSLPSSLLFLPLSAASECCGNGEGGSKSLLAEGINFMFAVTTEGYNWKVFPHNKTPWLLLHWSIKPCLRTVRITFAKDTKREEVAMMWDDRIKVQNYLSV